MASFLRARQAGVQNDLSAGIPEGWFRPGGVGPGEVLVKVGVNSQVR